MIWIKKGEYYIESDCGQYTISTTYHNGEARYSAWYKSQLLGIFVDTDKPGIDKAKYICTQWLMG